MCWCNLLFCSENSIESLLRVSTFIIDIIIFTSFLVLIFTWITFYYPLAVKCVKKSGDLNGLNGHSWKKFIMTESISLSSPPQLVLPKSLLTWSAAWCTQGGTGWCSCFCCEKFLFCASSYLPHHLKSQFPASIQKLHFIQGGRVVDKPILRSLAECLSCRLNGLFAAGFLCLLLLCVFAVSLSSKCWGCFFKLLVFLSSCVPFLVVTFGKLSATLVAPNKLRTQWPFFCPYRSKSLTHYWESNTHIGSHRKIFT